jgi:hypothetical protein
MIVLGIETSKEAMQSFLFYCIAVSLPFFKEIRWVD